MATTGGKLTRSGYIYALKHPKWDAYTKIGRARDLKKRLSQYQVGDPARSYHYLTYVWVEDRFQAEADLRKVLRPWHIRGEWYQIAELQLIRTMEEHIADGISMPYRPITDSEAAGVGVHRSQ